MPRRDGRGPRIGPARGGGGRMTGGGPGGPEYCVCPKCGIQTPQIHGQPCNQTTCPKCGIRMMRG